MPKISKETIDDAITRPCLGSYMSEPKRYMDLSLDVPYSSTPPSYNTQDELLDAMDAYIEECEAQNDLCGLAQLENSLDAKVHK